MTTPLAFLVRSATRDDIPAMVGLLERLFSIEADFSPDHARQRRGLEMLLKRSTQAAVWVAETEGRVIGMCTAQILVSTAQGSEVALVEDVVVDGAVRGAGIGRGLLTAVEQWARKRGVTRLQLLADTANEPALSFYHALAWRPTQLAAWRKFPG